MKKIIEVFKWLHEGEFNQYFFVIEEDKEDNFIKDMMTYLNEEVTKKEFPWSNPLDEFRVDNQVYVDFGSNSYITHLKTTYFLDFSYSHGFSGLKSETKRENIDIR